MASSVYQINLKLHHPHPSQTLKRVAYVYTQKTQRVPFPIIIIFMNTGMVSCMNYSLQSQERRFRHGFD